MTPAAAYYRMSTDEQEGSVAGQRASVVPMAKERGYRIVRDYIDEGISGDATDKRKAFQRMIADAVKGQFKAILCWDIDRFGRFDSIEAGYWIHPLRQAGVKLVTVTEGPINWDDFTGRVMYSLKTEGKHQYLRDLSKNVLRGMRDKSLAGLWVSGKPPLGYVIGDDEKLHLGEAHDVAAVRFLFDGYLAGHSLRTLTQELNAKGYLTARGKPFEYVGVRFILKNRNYTGDMFWNVRTESKYNTLTKGGKIEVSDGDGSQEFHDEADWMVAKDSHPAIVSREDFDAVQSRLAERYGSRSTPLPGGGKYVLSGLLRCAKCGSPMTGNTYAGHSYYVCCGYFHRGASFCDRNAVRQDELVERVIESIEGAFLNPSLIKKTRDEIRRQATASSGKSSVESIASRLAAATRDLKTAERNMAMASSDALRCRYESIVTDLAERERNLAAALKASQKPRKSLVADADARVDEAVRVLSSLRPSLQAEDSMRLREFLHLTIEQVRVRCRFEQKPKRKRFYLDGGTVAMKTNNLFTEAGKCKRVIQLKAS